MCPPYVVLGLIENNHLLGSQSQVRIRSSCIFNIDFFWNASKKLVQGTVPNCHVPDISTFAIDYI